MPNLRFERLFNRTERAVIVAMDHCLFDGPIEGMINLKETAAKVAPCVDGILLSPAMLQYCHDAFNYKGAPMAVVRLNWSTTYCFKWHYKQGATVAAFSAAEALRLGADVALVSLTLETGSEANDANNVAIFRQICREAKELGMPVIGEYFPAEAESLGPDDLHEKIYRGARIITELGADLIKTLYTQDFRSVTRKLPCPGPRSGGSEVAHPARRAFNLPLTRSQRELVAWCSGAMRCRFRTLRHFSRRCVMW